MFRSRTLFIVGAGASKEAKLPIGVELTKDIAERLNLYFEFARQSKGDRLIGEAIRRHLSAAGKTEGREYVVAARQISEGMSLANSIDMYMDTHRGNEHIQLCGKLAIVRAILEAERNSILCVMRPELRMPRERLSRIGETWYLPFFKMLYEGVSVSEPERIFENVAIVCFNYDRCIEEFLEAAVQVYYGFGEARAREVVQRLNIIHPYGTVGSLPWQNGSPKISFGGTDCDADLLLALSQGITTFTERIEDGKMLDAIRAEMRKAETVVFLGFGYLESNLRLLRPEGDSSVRQIFGTSVGFSQFDREVIQNQLIAMFPDRSKLADPVVMERVRLDDVSCAKFFDRHKRSLMA